jgi:hypothetical protein
VVLAMASRRLWVAYVVAKIAKNTCMAKKNPEKSYAFWQFTQVFSRFFSAYVASFVFYYYLCT